MPDPSLERRLKNYLVNQEFMLQYLRKFDQWPQVIAVLDVVGPPEGAAVVGICYSADYHAWVITVAHESFDAVPNCEMIPLVPNPLTVKKCFLMRDKDGAYRLSRQSRELPHSHADELTLMPTDKLETMAERIKEILYDRQHRKP